MRATRFAVLGAMIGIVSAASAQSPGELDESFGQAGLTQTTLPASAIARDVVAMSDGGWIASGNVVSLAGKIKLNVPVLTRYSANGRPDTSFGNQGTVLAPSSLGDNLTQPVLFDGTRLYQIALDSSVIRVMAYTLAGQPDLSWGDGGTTEIEAGTQPHPVLGATLQNGRVLIVSSGRPQNSEIHWHFLLARLKTNGQLDDELGGGGKRYFQIYEGVNAENVFTDVALQADGKIVAAGRGRNFGTNHDMVVARFDTNGNPDPSFGDGGFRHFRPQNDSPYDNNRGRAVAVLGDGSIVVAGSACASLQPGEFCRAGVVKLLSGGNLDPSFGSGGMVVFALPSPPADPGVQAVVLGLAVDHNGRIVLSGMTDVSEQAGSAYLLRLTASGTVDESFGDDGVVYAPYHGAVSGASNVVVTPMSDGTFRLITVGHRSLSGTTPSSMVIARHLYD